MSATQHQNATKLHAAAYSWFCDSKCTALIRMFMFE